MRAYAQKQNNPQRRSQTNFMRSNILAPAASQDSNRFLHSERTIKNHAGQPRANRLEAGPAEDGPAVEFSQATLTANRFAWDFSRIPVHAPAPPTKLWRKCACGGSCPECKDEDLRLQRKDVTSSQSGQTAAPPIVEEALANGGSSLPDGLRDDMGRRFAYDFSNVRLHTHARAEESAAVVGARAYTVGKDVVFAAGEYAPHTDAGRQLIAHELAHVVQQHEAHASDARAGITIGASNDPLEREAEAAAQRANTDAVPGIARTSLSAGASRLAHV
jgi:hypothetical protein